jgi:uncharacterized protein (TIGR02300 family)
MRRVAKPKLGTKRICPNCGTRYYDLEKDPIICPKCGTRFEAPTRGRAAAPAPVEDEVEETPEAPEAEFVTLETADEEASGGAEEAEEEDVEIETPAGEEFLEEEEEGEEDVGDIIGDVDEEEER